MEHPARALASYLNGPRRLRCAGVFTQEEPSRGIPALLPIVGEMNGDLVRDAARGTTLRLALGGEEIAKRLDQTGLGMIEPLSRQRRGSDRRPCSRSSKST